MICPMDPGSSTAPRDSVSLSGTPDKGPLKLHSPPITTTIKVVRRKSLPT